MPNQSKISLPQATAGGRTSFPKFNQQSLEETEVSTKYNDAVGEDPTFFQTKNSVMKEGITQEYFDLLPG